MDKLKILVVDDESRMRKLVKDYLVKNNYSVIEAENGEQAIDIFMGNSQRLRQLSSTQPGGGTIFVQPLFCQDPGNGIIVGLQRDFLTNQEFPAQQHASTAIVGQKAVVVSTALPQPLTEMVAGQTGENGKIHRIGGDHMVVCRRLWDAVGAGGKLGQGSDLSKLHNAVGDAQRDAEDLPGGQNIF